MKSGFLGIAGLIIGILVFFVTLNYFNVLSLSKIYPNQLGFLPHQTQKTSNISALTENPKIVCPVDQSNCKNGVLISVPNTSPTVYSITYKTIPARSLLYAVISGQYRVDLIPEKDGTQAKLINIINEQKGISATYVFKGDVLPAQVNGFVTQKQEIGSLSGEKLSKEFFGKSYTLVISIKDLKNNVYLQTIPQ